MGVKALVTRPASSAAARGPGIAQVFAGAADSATTGARKVLVAGDANAFLFSYHSGGYDADGIYGVIYGSYACGIAVGPQVVNGTDIPLDKRCGNWPREYKTVASNFKPDVSLLMVGVGQAATRRVNGHVLATGSPELEQYLDGQLDKARAALTSTGGRFGILNDACTGSDLAGSRSTVSWLNSVWDHYAAHHSGVFVADYDQFACPKGKPAADRSGSPYLDSRGAMTPVGADQTWKWIASTVVGGAGKSGT
jgi:hypothetical protein